jgi:hypothetical protein
MYINLFLDPVHWSCPSLLPPQFGREGPGWSLSFSAIVETGWKKSGSNEAEWIGVWMDDCENGDSEVSGIWATVVYGVFNGSVKSCKFRKLLFKPIKVGIGLLVM